MKKYPFCIIQLNETGVQNICTFSCTEIAERNVHKGCPIFGWVVRAELAQVIAGSEGFSARDLFLKDFQLVTFFTSTWKWAKIPFYLKIYFWSTFMINSFWKWLTYAAKLYYLTLINSKKHFLCYTNSDKWSWNWLES